jgi:hypothetical protein
VSRAALIGACYGAMHGGAALEAESVSCGVPSSWVGLLHNGERVLDSARKLAEMRSSLH